MANGNLLFNFGFRVNGSYFMACGWNTGYFGIQQLGGPEEKVVLFSVWDPTKGDDPNAVKKEDRVEVLYQAEDVRIKRFGGEGTGGQCLWKYAWRIGETNRFMVGAVAQRKRTAYTAWFWTGGIWKKLATFRTGTSGHALTGYYSFIEDFRRDGRSVGEVRRARFGNGWVRTTDGDWVSLAKARFTASNAEWEAKENIDAGVKDDCFYLATGGDIRMTRELRSSIDLPITPTMPAKLLKSLSSVASSNSAGASPQPPYPHSPTIKRIVWQWETYTNAAPGSDLWPVAWGPDDNLYAAWGDGGGFGGSDTDGRVPLGFARIEGTPGNWQGFNINGGKNPEHPASFPHKGKTTGIAFVDGVLYATVNLEDGPWPEVNHVLAWSKDKGATWTRSNWLFEKGPGHFQPAKFVSFGKDYTGLPAPLAGYVYICGPKQAPDRVSDKDLYLARVPRNKLTEHTAYEFYRSSSPNGNLWVADFGRAQPIFTDLNGVTPGTIVYVDELKRFLLTCFHAGPGQLGVFDAPNPWGPWTTVAYLDDWGGMGSEGEGLTCGFPQKWTSADGLTLWSVFSVYGEGGKRGINAHDKFNLIKACLELER